MKTEQGTVLMTAQCRSLQFTMTAYYYNFWCMFELAKHSCVAVYVYCYVALNLALEVRIPEFVLATF